MVKAIKSSFCLCLSVSVCVCVCLSVSLSLSLSSLSLSFNQNVALFKGLLAGWYDACVGVYPTPERLNSFNFSTAFSSNFHMTLHYKKGGSAEGHALDLTGRKVGRSHMTFRLYSLCKSPLEYCQTYLKHPGSNQVCRQPYIGDQFEISWLRATNLSLLGFVRGWSISPSCLARQSSLRGNQDGDYTAVYYGSEAAMMKAIQDEEVNHPRPRDLFEACVHRVSWLKNRPRFSQDCQLHLHVCFQIDVIIGMPQYIPPSLGLMSVGPSFYCTNDGMSTSCKIFSEWEIHVVYIGLGHYYILYNPAFQELLSWPGTASSRYWTGGMRLLRGWSEMVTGDDSVRRHRGNTVRCPTLHTGHIV